MLNVHAHGGERLGRGIDELDCRPDGERVPARRAPDLHAGEILFSAEAVHGCLFSPYGGGMDDFWGVIWGAGIALFASVIGGLLTAVVGPWLARRAARAEENRRSAAASRAQVRTALSAVAIGMNHWLFAREAGDQDGVKKARYEVAEAQIALRMWTSTDEKDVDGLIYGVMGSGEFNDSLLRVTAWEHATSRWFRGDLDASGVGKAYEENLETGAPLAAKWREEDARVEAATSPTTGGSGA